MEEIEKVRKREEIPVEDTWSLEDLFASDSDWFCELDCLKTDVKVLSEFAGRLKEGAQTLCSFLDNYEKADIRLSLLGSYCMRREDQDTRNPVYQAMSGQFMSEAVAFDTAVSFADPEIMAIPEETMNSFYVIYPPLERYRRYLTEKRRLKNHTPNAEQARLLASAGELARGPENIFGAFMDADMVYPDAVDAAGTHHSLSNGTFVPLQMGNDRVLRRSAYEQFYHTLGNFRNTAAAMLNAHNKQAKFFAAAHNYGSAFEAALDRTGIPQSVYLNLIEAVHQNVDKMHRYVRLRKKLLGVDELHFYDIYTPLVRDVDRTIPFAEAKQTVYDALKPMGEDYRSILKEGFTHRWIDVYENEGKRGGAYSAGTPVHPYVLMNYSGTLKSQFTLAHEMGHALHSYFSGKNQNPIDADYVIFVAEVASTCNEALLMQHLLSSTSDRMERAYLLNHFLEQLKGTIFRQTMFAEFELFMGRMIDAGKSLTADLLCSEYRRLNELYFGPDMVVDDEISMEWARIPHFYYNYYVYQYATGYSAAIAISEKILHEGEKAVGDYLGFLSGGCSKSPIELLKGVGVDMTEEKPVSDALKLFGELLDQLEELTAEE